MKGGAASGLPRQSLVIRTRAFGEKEVDAQQIPYRRGAGVHRCVWNPHERVPSFGPAVDARRGLETGVPEPAVLMPWGVEVDVQVHPFTLRRHLEFLVSSDIVEIRADERLGHVPVPE